MKFSVFFVSPWLIVDFMEYKPNIETVLKRYKAFWQKDVYDRPPIRIRYPIPGQSDEDWPAASQSPETYYPYWDNVYRQRVELLDDDVCSATVDMGPGFMGGVMGCPVYFDHGTRRTSLLFQLAKRQSRHTICRKAGSDRQPRRKE